MTLEVVKYIGCVYKNLYTAFADDPDICRLSTPVIQKKIVVLHRLCYVSYQGSACPG